MKTAAATMQKTMDKWIDGPFAPTLDAQMEAIAMVRQGIPYKTFLHAATRLGLAPAEAMSYLHISERTAFRVKASASTKDTVLNSKQSEGLLRLVRVVSLASRTLGSTEKALKWIERPNRALNEQTPASLLDTELGATLVSDVLGRIEYGVYS